MAVSGITPSSGDTISAGDSFSFTITDGYSLLQVEVDAESSTEYAYDSALGGGQGGYTVVVVPGSGDATYTISRDAGWDISPQNIRIIEDATTTAINYSLLPENAFPQGSNPYSGETPATGVVDSVFGRVGVVTAQPDDYAGSEVGNDSGVAGDKVSDALDTLAAAPSGSIHRIFISGEPNPQTDNWRQWDEDGGPYNMNGTAWATGAGSSGSGSITLDPDIFRWDMGWHFTQAATITKVTLAATCQGAHAAFDIYYQLWKLPVVDLDETDGALTKVASVNYTNDGTINKVYVKEWTIDSASIAAGDSLSMYFATPDAAGNGEKQRFYLTIEYTVD